jgi:hypothetical protein
MEDRPSTQPLWTNKSTEATEEDDVYYGGTVTEDEYDKDGEEETKESEPPTSQPASTPLSVASPKKNTPKLRKTSKGQPPPPSSILEM